MSAQGTAQRASHKSFQEQVAETICKGDLEGFRQSCVSKYDIDRPLRLPRDLMPVPQYHPDEQYIRIQTPTIVIFTILCEQDKILEYILAEKAPDLNVRCDGFTALHIAAMTKDWRCLALLRQYSFIQQNIDVGVDLRGIQVAEGDKTTALHCAISNKCVENVALLLSPFPTPIDQKEDDNKEENAVASVLQKSGVGSTPIYLAVKVRSPEIAKLLMAAAADPSEPCRNGETALALAEKLKDQALERRKSAPVRPEPPGKKGRRHHRQRQCPEELVYEVLNSKWDHREAVFVECCPDLTPIQPPVEEVEEDEYEYDDEKPKKPKTDADQKSLGSDEARRIYGLLEQMNRRLDALERAPRVAPEAAVRTTVTAGHICCVCSSGPATECAECHRYFCDRCGAKTAVHSCH